MSIIKCFLISTLFVCSLAQASVGSSQVPLSGGGNVQPKATVAVSLKGIIKDADYKVTCDITNPNSNTVDMAFDMRGTVFPYSYGQSFVNGKRLSAGNATLNPGINTFKLPSASAAGPAETALTFTNLDDTSIVGVSNCIAVPVTSGR